MLDKLFYIIYNAYHKQGDSTNDIPSLTVGGIFSMVWLSIAYSIYLLLFKDHPRPSPGYLLFGGAVITYMLFYFNKRYKKIYERYKGDAVLNTKTAKVIGFTIAILGILSPVVTALLRNQIVSGKWV